ncbi:hypothetical protein NDU88_002905 [Pleurodeles waltl]|uniref:Uncharacterized protein n=1 Tax=Pleurodeles waltl TaxID=8319 RepID=A0AAV7KU35_PLEWA|nr:hypothetical protein NDU88_002905 [Pleurodeles waltl]
MLLDHTPTQLVKQRLASEVCPYLSQHGRGPPPAPPGRRATSGDEVSSGETLQVAVFSTSAAPGNWARPACMLQQAATEQQHEQPRRWCPLCPTGARSSGLPRGPCRPGHKPPQSNRSMLVWAHPPALSAVPGRARPSSGHVHTAAEARPLPARCDLQGAPQSPSRRPQHHGPHAAAALRASAVTPPHRPCTGLRTQLRALHRRITWARRTTNKDSSTSRRPSSAQRSLYCRRWPCVLLLMPDKP